jgi:hypothetical protein
MIFIEEELVWGLVKVSFVIQQSSQLLDPLPLLGQEAAAGPMRWVPLAENVPVGLGTTLSSKLGRVDRVVDRVVDQVPDRVVVY